MPSRRSRYLLFAALTAVGLVLIFEGISFLTVWAIDGQPFSYRRYEARRASILGREDRAEVAHLGPDPARELGAGDITSGREVLHPFLGFVFNPELNEREKRLERGELLIGRHGFFHAPGTYPEPEEAAEETVEIAVFGGSVAMLFAFNGEERLRRRLDASPSLAGRKIRIRSFALGGYKQPQQLLALTYFLSLGERFDAVINLDGFNELALAYFDNYRHGVYPFYPRAWKQRVDLVPDREFQVEVAQLAILRARRAGLARKLSGPLGASVTANLFWALVDRKLAADLQRQQLALAELPASERTYTWQGPYEPLPSDEAVIETLVEHWRDSSLQMHRLCAANQIRYLHVLQPNQYLPGSKPMRAEEERVAIDPQSPYRRPAELGYPRLRAAGEDLRRSGVRFLDASMLFAEVEEPLYTDGCCHFNRRGNEILADAIAERLLAE